MVPAVMLRACARRSAPRYACARAARSARYVRVLLTYGAILMRSPRCARLLQYPFYAILRPRRAARLCVVIVESPRCSFGVTPSPYRSAVRCPRLPACRHANAAMMIRCEREYARYVLCAMSPYSAPAACMRERYLIRGSRAFTRYALCRYAMRCRLLIYDALRSRCALRTVSQKICVRSRRRAVSCYADAREAQAAESAPPF